QMCTVINLLINNATHTSIYTLPLHDALPIWEFLEKSLKTEKVGETEYFRVTVEDRSPESARAMLTALISELIRNSVPRDEARRADRKSTRLDSSHVKISYAVFCLKKKKQSRK